VSLRHRLTSGHCFSHVFWKVNKSLHWSVAVVVNPGAILEHIALLSDEVDIPSDMAFPCILFFDSLKAHAQNRVAGKVREWLNSEWKRLRPESGNDAPFTAKSMKIYSPKGSSSVFSMPFYVMRLTISLVGMAAIQYHTKTTGKPRNDWSISPNIRC
jgi:hypothetical protein